MTFEGEARQPEFPSSGKVEKKERREMREMREMRVGIFGVGFGGNRPRFPSSLLPSPLNDRYESLTMERLDAPGPRGASADTK